MRYNQIERKEYTLSLEKSDGKGRHVQWKKETNFTLIATKQNLVINMTQ